MYGHIFFRNSSERQAEFINSELSSGKYESLEEVAKEILIAETDIKAELACGGFYFISEINRFFCCQLDKVS